MNQGDQVVVSSEDVITAYQERVSELVHENALLKARIAKMDREATKVLPRPLGTQAGTAEEPAR